MTLAELRSEFEAQRGPGPLILQEIRTVVRSVVARYPPRIYGGSDTWKGGEEDLLQDFTLKVLLEQGQLAYAILVAENEAHFRNLVARQLRFHLSKSRQRTVVDNLLDRCKQLTREAPFRQVEIRAKWRVALDEKALGGASPTPSSIAEVAAELAVIPMHLVSTGDRAPQVYSTENLALLLVEALKRLGTALTVEDLSSLFERLLTPLLPRLLVPLEGETLDSHSVDISPEEAVIAESAVEAVVFDLSIWERKVLLWKLADISDSDIGSRLGISRPTVLKHKKAALEKAKPHLLGMSEKLQIQALERMGVRLLSTTGRTEDDEQSKS